MSANGMVRLSLASLWVTLTMLHLYDFWHEGFGKHIFSAVATACANTIWQMWTSSPAEEKNDLT
jgi:hypothetical protein